MSLEVRPADWTLDESLAVYEGGGNIAVQLTCTFRDDAAPASGSP
jgi:hypothetical protein